MIGFNDKMDSLCQVSGIIVPLFINGMKESMYAVYDNRG